MGILELLLLLLGGVLAYSLGIPAAMAGFDWVGGIALALAGLTIWICVWSYCRAVWAEWRRIFRR